MKPIHTRIFFLTVGLSLLAGAINIQAAVNTWTIATGATGNWSTAANWTGAPVAGGVPDLAGNVAKTAANATWTLTLDSSRTLGVVQASGGSAGNNWTINTGGSSIVMTMDNTGGNNNPLGDANAYIGATGGGLVFNPNIIIQNTDLDMHLGSSTTPSVTIGTLGTSTITATSARNLFLIENENKAGEKSITINSSIGATGSPIAIQNTGPGTGTAVLAGVVGPNASVTENSVAGSAGGSALRLDNGANNYTGATTITLGTLLLNANNAIPSSSSVNVVGGILNLNGKTDTIGGLSGAGTVNGTSGTLTLTVGGGNAGGTFSGIIQNNGATTLSLAKTGNGTQVMSGANTYNGTTTISGGFLNAGVADGGSSGPFGNAGGIFFNGGALQYSAANQNDYSARFSTTANNAISIDTAGQNVSFATALTSSGGSLTKVGNGTLTLNAVETYSGNTTVNGGTLALASGSSLSTSSTISISAGGTLDVSALATPYTLGSAASFKGSGMGTGIGTTAANLVAASGGTFDLGSQPIAFTWNGGSSGTDSTHPSLLVSQGTLNFSGNTITVVVPGTPLAAGVYTLVSAPAITGSPSATPSYTGGNGVAVGNGGVISVSGSTVILTVTASGGVVGTWSTDADGNWSDSSKWSGGVPHSAKDTGIFGTGSSLRTVTLDVNETAGLLTFNNANSFVIANGGNTLTLDNSGAGATLGVSGGTANAIQTAVALNDNTVITVGSGKSLALSAPVSNSSGTRTLTLNGVGTTILSAANSFGPSAGTVGTTLSAGGTLQFGNNAALGAGDLSASGNSTIQAGASVNLANNIAIADTTTVNNNGNDLSLSGVISGAGGLTKVGNHTLTLSGINTYSGNTTVNGGALSLSSQSNVANSPSIIFNGGDLLGNGTFTINNGVGIGLPSGGVGTNALIDAASGQIFTLSGIIGSSGNSGADGLLINTLASSPGTVDLAGANTFNGPTLIANGTLELDNSLALQGSTLNYNTGTLIFGNSIAAATLGGLSGANSSQSLVLTNTTGGLVTLTVGGNNAATIYGGNLTDGGLNASFVKVGTGTLTLSNANYTGSTTVNGTAVLTINGGSFGSPSSTITVATTAGGNTFLMNAGTATAGNFNVAIAGGQTGVGATIGGTANLTNTTTTIGNNGNTAGALTLNSAGNVNLGDVKIAKDGGVGSGLVVAGGNVVATSVTVAQSGTSARASDMNVTGGTLTIADPTQSGKFIIHGVAGNGTLTMSGGALNYLGTDGLLMSVGTGNPTVASITAGTATLSGVTLNSGGGAATSTLTVNGTNASLYLGSVGLVINSPSATVAATFGNGTFGAYVDWTSVAPITLTNNPNFKAADISNVPHNITLNGVLSGATNLVKTGKGILTLGGVNTYSGLTIVTNGTLVVNGLTAGAGVDIRTNATLGGAGTNSDLSVIIENGGHTLPGGTLGNTAGLTLTVANTLSYNSGAEADFNAGSSYNSGDDKIIVNGSLNATNLSVGINFTGSGNMDTSGYYNLFHVPGNLSAFTVNPTPIWTGVTPANSSLFSIVVLGNDVILSGSPIKVTSATATPNSAGHGQTVTFAVNVTAGSFTINPSTGISLNASALGGSPTLFLIRSNGTSLYTNSIIIPVGTALGSYANNYSVADSNGDVINAQITATVGGAPEVWNGNASPDNTWSNVLNWANGSAPLTGDLVTFAGTHQLTPNMESPYNIGALTFDSTAGSFNITNDGTSSLTLTGGATNNSANTQVVSVPVILNSRPTFNAASGNIIISNSISDDGNGFVKTGTNTLKLAVNNTSSGPITINSGTLSLFGNNGGSPITNNATLRLANDNALISSTVTLDNGSTLQLRSDINDTFQVGTLALQSASDKLTFDASPLTTGVTGNTLTLSGGLTFATNFDHTINVTGNSTYTLALGDITLLTSSHNPVFNLFINTQPAGPALTINSVTCGNFDSDIDFNGGGTVTVINNLLATSNGSVDLFVNNGTTATLMGQVLDNSVTSDGNKYDVVNGTLVLDNGNALFNNTSGAGLGQSLFILGAATNIFNGSGYSQSTNSVTATNNSFNAAIYLGDANNGGGLTTPANLTNNVSDGDVGFTNSGVFTIGGLNASGDNVYANPIILGWTANRGKSVTLISATGGEVDFANILANGTDQTAGVTVGDATHHGLVKFTGNNTYRGNTTINGGTLEVANPNFSSNSVVSIASGALLQLDYSTTNAVTALVVNGVLQAPGVYTSVTTPTYIAGSGSLKVVGPLTPVLQTAPTAATINLGQTLAASTLTGGSVTNGSGANVPGAFAYTTPSTIPPAGVSAQSVTFTPSDTVHYSAFTFNVNVTVVSISALKFTAAPVISGTSLTISGTNTGGGTFYLLSSTNLTTPVRIWTPIWTNNSSSSGNFITNLTGVVNPSLGQQFYILSSTN